jgi:hypothetical protein
MKFLFFILFSSAFPLLHFLPETSKNKPPQLSNLQEYALRYEISREQYKKYTPIQKLQYWKQRLNQADKLTSLTPTQRHICIQIERTLTLSLFKNPFYYNLDSLTNKVISVLGKEKTAYLFASMATTEEEYHLIDPPHPTSKPECKCSTKSDFCSGVYKCTATDECKTTSAGCGFFFFYSCSGNCK